MLLTVIAVELGFLAIKLPTPTAQAGPSITTAPAPALQDPHGLIIERLDQVQRDVAELKRWRGTEMDLFMRDMRFLTESEAKRLWVVCYLMNQHYFTTRSGPMIPQEEAVEKTRMQSPLLQGAVVQGKHCLP